MDSPAGTSQPNGSSLSNMTGPDTPGGAGRRSETVQVHQLPPIREPTWVQRYGLIIVGVSPIFANAIGSVFNILYNQTQIEPLLSSTQMERFEACWQWYNVLVYPIAIACYLVPLFGLWPTHRALLEGREVAEDRLASARRRVVNLPWWFLGVAAIGWLSCIPVFPLALHSLGEPLSREVVVHLATSFVIASLIAVTQSFFAVELATQKVLFPVFFRGENPASVPGAFPLSMTARGLLWVFSAVVSPVVSLILILLVPDAANQSPYFGVAVGIVAIVFAIATSWMLVRLIVVPIGQLQSAAERVAAGDLHARVDLLRADELGLLIERFNHMVDGLREREHLQQTFGRHVGRQAAKQILSEGDDLGGREQEVTVMFVDVRDFTAHSSRQSPKQVVSALNVFFRQAVDTVEAHGGMVNKFLGDGLMALFGIGPDADGHARRAVDAGVDLHHSLQRLSGELSRAGWPGLRIGIGINTGKAVVGSIGSPKRQEYTAIGDTINVASRVESLTKQVGQPLLITGATRVQLGERFPLIPIESQRVKGKAEPLELFAVSLAEA
jgi:adenylate cyclase